MIAQLLAIVLMAAPAAQQPRDTVGARATGTAVLAGSVLDNTSNRPIRRVSVTVNGDNGVRRTTITDDDGKFVFRSLAAGHYTISAVKAAYVQVSYGARRPGRPGIPVTLTAGQQLTTLQLKMPHGGAITGIIVDQNGRPQANVRVQAMERRIVNGERRLVQAGSTSSSGTTDDRGVYRLYGLPAGEYVVIATPPTTFSDLRLTTADQIQWAQQELQRQSAPGAAGAPPTAPPRSQPVAYAGVFYPGTSDLAAAATVTVAGDERSGIDFPVRLVPTANISGVVLGPDGRPASAQLTLMTASINPGSSSGTGKSTDRSGAFTFTGIPPGVHRIMARTDLRFGGDLGGRGGGGAMGVERGFVMGEQPAAGPRLFAVAEVAVNGEDLSGLVITLQPGSTLSGKMVFQGATPAPFDLSRASVTILPAPGDNAAMAMAVPSQTVVGPDGKFRVEGIAPGKYRVNAAVGPAAPSSKWFLRSAVANGADVLDGTLEVRAGEDVTDLTLVFSDQQTEISGKLVDTHDAPALDYMMIAFSTDKTAWVQSSRRTRTTRPGPDGHYSIAGLPPGEYFLAAVTDADATDLYDTSFLEEVSAGALRIKIAEGEKKTQDLRLARIP